MVELAQPEAHAEHGEQLRVRGQASGANSASEYGQDGRPHAGGWRRHLRCSMGSALACMVVGVNLESHEG